MASPRRLNGRAASLSSGTPYVCARIVTSAVVTISPIVPGCCANSKKFEITSCPQRRQCADSNIAQSNRKENRRPASAVGSTFCRNRALEDYFLEVLVLYRERSGEEGYGNAATVGAGAFSIQRLEGSRFGTVVLWVLNGGACGRGSGAGESTARSRLTWSP
jgi:hypothetical protein